MLLLTGFLCMVIPLAMSLYNSYYSDFQAQGRYLMPGLIPLMMMIAGGYDALPGTFSEKEGIKKAGPNRACVITCLLILFYMILFLISFFGYLGPNCLTIFIGS